MLPKLAERHSYLYKVLIPRSTDRAVLPFVASLLRASFAQGILRKVREDVER